MFLPLGQLMGLCAVAPVLHERWQDLVPLLVLAQGSVLLWWWGRTWELPYHLLVQGGLAALAVIASFTPGQPLLRWLLLLAVLLASSVLPCIAIAFRLRELQPAPTSDAACLRQAGPWLPATWRIYLWCKLRFDPVYARLQGTSGRWGEVLDLGCGCGLGALVARAQLASGYCGIDLDLQKLVVARTLLTRSGRPLDGAWRLLHGQLPFPQPLPARFDTVLLLDVLHYWPPEQQQRLLEQARLAAAPGARLFLRLGSGDRDGRAGLVDAGERFTTGIGLNPATATRHFPERQALSRLLEACAWHVEACEPCGAENLLWCCRAVPAAAASPPPSPWAGAPGAQASAS